MTLDAKIKLMQARMEKKGLRVCRLESIQEIQAAVCAAFGITNDEFWDKRGTPWTARARCASMKLMRDRMDGTMTYQQIAIANGKKDHNSALSACNSFAGYYSSCKQFKRAVDTAIALLDGQKIDME